MWVGDNETHGSENKNSLLLPAIATATVPTFCSGFPALIPIGQHEENLTDQQSQRIETYIFIMGSKHIGPWLHKGHDLSFKDVHHINLLEKIVQKKENKVGERGSQYLTSKMCEKREGPIISQSRYAEWK